MKKQYLAKNLLILTFLMLSVLSYAQVGIGNTNPNSNALLDVGTNTSTAGLRLPRVALTATNNTSPLSAHVSGMLVYNTATAGLGTTAVTPGFYYNDGTNWVRLANNDDWKLVGNTGTNPTTNFLGTTDAQDLVLRSNNVEHLRVGVNETAVNENSNSYSFRVESNSQQYMLFVDGTNDAVGIGTSTPGTYGGTVNVDKFHVVGSATNDGAGNFTPVSSFVNNGDGASIFVKNELTTSTDPAIECGVEGTGYAIRALHLPSSGTGAGVYGSTNAASTAWAGYFNGNVLATNYFVPSDRKWKKNISSLKKSNYLDKIMLLKPKSYQWKKEEFPGLAFQKNKTSFGFIAQELKEIFPELVSEKSIPDPTKKINTNQTNNFVDGYYLVNYIGLIPILTQVIQEQQKTIENQDNKIKDIEEKLLQLEEKLNNLTKN